MKLHAKVLSVLFGLAFFAPSVFAQVGTSPFSDVSYNVHFEAIYKMKEWGIFEGYADGSFGASKEINRAELSKALVLGAGIDEMQVKDCAVEATKSFIDVPAGEWYADYVYCAQSKNWVSGDDGKNTFRPADPVVLPEAFKMILESQVGTPDNSFAGSEWYDIYLNALLEAKVISEGGTLGNVFYTYTFLPPTSNSLLGFTGDGDIGAKITRQDVAELIYRARMIFEEGGEWSVYDPSLTLREYEEKYGASVEESGPGVVSIRDPHFGFEIDHVYLGNLDADDLRVLIWGPSAFANGSSTEWALLYPGLESRAFEDEGLDFSTMLTVDIDGRGPQMELEAGCGSKYDRPFELWEVYDTMCGEEGAEAEDIGALLRLRSYGENYTGEIVELRPIENGPLSVLKFNDVMADAAAYAYAHKTQVALDYLESLSGLQSIDGEQQSALHAWREAFVEDFFLDSDEVFAGEYFELEPLLLEYEAKMLAEMGDTLVLEVPITSATSYHQISYIIYGTGEDYEILEGDFGDYFWPSFSLKFSKAKDPFEGRYFGVDQSVSHLRLRITVENRPVPFGDFDMDFTDWIHVAVYAHGLYREAYYYEIISAEVVEE